MIHRSYETYDWPRPRRNDYSMRDRPASLISLGFSIFFFLRANFAVVTRFVTICLGSLKKGKLPSIEIEIFMMNSSSTLLIRPFV